MYLRLLESRSNSSETIIFPQGRFFGTEMLQNHTNDWKEKGKGKSEEEERRRREKEMNALLLVFIMAIFYRQKLLDAKGPFRGNVYKNPAR